MAVVVVTDVAGDVAVGGAEWVRMLMYVSTLLLLQPLPPHLFFGSATAFGVECCCWCYRCCF